MLPSLRHRPPELKNLAGLEPNQLLELRPFSLLVVSCEARVFTVC